MFRSTVNAPRKHCLRAALLCSALVPSSVAIPCVDSGDIGESAVATREIVFVDSRVADRGRLIDDLFRVERGSRHIEVRLLDAGGDGISRIGEVLSGRRALDAVHVVSHGEAGVLELGAARLDGHSLQARAEAIAGWGAALGPEGDLLLYGCNVAAGATGRALVDGLARLTGADVAASVDATGNPALGGDWRLEYRTGRVQAPVAVSRLAQANWAGLLAIATNGSATSAATPGSSNSLSWSHTVNGGTDRVLFVGLSLVAGQSTGVTYGGAPLTLVGRYTDGSSHTVEIWRRVAPVVGSANVVASFDASRQVIGGALTFDGVDQTTPAGTLQTATGDSDSPSVTVPTTAGDWVLDTLFVDVNSLTATADGGRTEHWNLTNSRLGAGSTDTGVPSVVMSWTLSGDEEWTLGAVAIKPVVGHSITGVVFEDADFAGSATAYDAGGDKLLQGVDVELYDGGTDAYIASTTTAADGSYSFSGLADGSYKVRVRSATLGSGGAAPLGGLNPGVPGTWPLPLAEMTWGDGAPLYGGQSPTVDDTATGDDAGPGDTHVPVNVSGAGVGGVDFGFAYNLIVHTVDDANADGVRSAQGSLRQFLKNANAIGSTGGTTASSSQFRLPATDPNYDSGTGVFTITPSTLLLPALADAGTTLDAATQAANTSDTNPGNLGAGGKVGVDQLDLSTVPAPEVEIAGSGTLTNGLRITADNATIRGLSIYGFDETDTGDGGIHLADGTSGALIEQNVIGSRADAFADPGAGARNFENVYSGGADNGILRNNLVGFGGIRGILLAVSSDGWTIEDNEFRDNSLDTPAGDGIALDPGTADVTGNLVVGSASQGIVVAGSTGSTFTNNTITGNGIGTATTSGAAAGMTLRGTASTHTVDRNEFTANYAAGLSVNDGADGIKITRNAFSANGTIVARNGDPATGQIGIDLNNPTDDANTGTFPYPSPNDPGDTLPGGNDLLNFPVLDTAWIFGPNLELTGWARPGSVIEVFVADGDPTNFGEGQTYKLTLTESGTGAGGEDPYADLDGTTADPYGPGAVNGIVQGQDSTNRFRFSFPLPAGVVAGTKLTATARDGSDNTSEFGGHVAVQVAPADLELTKTDSPDPAPLSGPLVYTLLITNHGPGTATGVTVTDVLPASVTLQSATPSQGGCSGTTTVTCTLGAIVATGTASVEILVTTTATGTIVNNASVSANETDPVAGNDADVASTEVTADTAILDLPLTQYRRIHGFVDYTVTGASLRTQANGGGGAACQVGASASASLAGIPATATISAAYLYWAGSGATVDADVTFDGGAITADRTYQGRFSLGANDYEFFGGFEDVTAQVVTKRNGSYSFQDLTVDTGSPYCDARAVLAGWSLIVVYEDPALSGKTLVLYDGFDIERNGTTSYLLTGIYSADPPEAKTTLLVWEGDEDLGAASEFLEFNGTPQSDGLNPVDNVYNSTINSLGSSTSYGMDLDTYDVSAQVSPADTLATAQVSVASDLVILNAVVLQVKSNLIAGYVFEDVNYGGGAGRDRATATAAAPTFTVDRPGAVVELYDAAGNFLRTTTTGATGEYGFTGLVDGTYQVRVVNDTVTSSRPGATGSEWPVATFRTDASSGAAAAVTGEVGGAVPGGQDSPANAGMANLGTLTAQSVAPALITTGIAVPGVDFGYNFDTVVNTNGSGQGSLYQFLLNANSLTNANLDQAGLTSGVETSVFMIPSAADPWGRAKDPNFDAGRGVATITVTTPLPALVDPATAVDGTTQTALVGDTNAGTAGNPELAGAGVGTGPDGIEASGDEPSLPSYPRPEIEIDGDDRGIILEIAGSGSSLRGLSVFNAPSAATGILVSAGTGSEIAGNFIGPDADGADPLAGSRIAHGVEVFGGAADVTDNFVAYTEDTALIVENDSVISGNEVYRASLGNASGDGISVEGSTGQTITVRRNRVDRSAAYGFESWNAPGPFTVEDNTFSRSGQGGGVENGGVRLFGTASTVRNNVVTGSAGAGVVLAQRNAPGSNLQNRITQNAIYANGGLGIDLDATNTGLVNPNGDAVTANDGVVDANLPNRVLDYPIITSALLAGTTLRVDGYVGTAALKIAGTHTLEFFKADDDGNNDGEVVAGDAQSVAHGEGRWFIDSCVTAADGSFDCALTVPAAAGLATGDAVTATTRDVSSNTSEFSANTTVTPGLSIVKRAFLADGTPIASGSTLPSGTRVKFLLYIDNPYGAVGDASLQDVLDPAFVYQAGSMKLDGTLASSTVCPAGVCDEAAIFAQVDGSGTPLGDGDAVTPPIDADVGSYDVGATRVDLGDGTNANNARLDLNGDRVLALVLTTRMQ